MKKVLLTTVCRPLGPKHGDAPSVGYELLFGQVTRSQGIFSPRATHLQYGLEFIAHNLDTPATVLHYPSKRELIRELKKGYDFVGISFILSTFHRMKEVSALVREHAPKSRIVLGGYGTVLSDEELGPYGDLVCRGEGVAFMRELLGEPPRPLPYDHPSIVSRLKLFGVPVSSTGMVFAGLGCPNGCDFCSTSHFFSRKHIPLLPTGSDIYRVVKSYLDKDPGVQFTVLDEDFLLNKARALEFKDCVIRGGRPLSMFAFASFKALSQYSVDELLEMGVDGVWIGYEGTRSGYEKQKGRPPQDIIPELRRRGVTVLASMIVGFDYQDQAVVDAELRGLLRLRPHLSQFLIYAPMPGTPFYQRVLAEGRLRPEFVSNRPDFLRKCTGFASLVAHPKLGRPEIEALQERCFQRDYERLGPSIFRVIGAWMNGAVSLRGASSEILRKKSLGCAAAVRRTYPIFLAGRLFGPNPRIRRWIGAMERRAHRLFGAPTLLERAQSLVMLAMAAWTHLSLKIDWLQHPRPKPRRFRWDSGPGDLVRFFGERTPAGMASELRVFLEQKAAGMRLRLEGALDGKNGEQFRRRMEAALARGQQACVVNLEGLKSMDRKGLALFYKTFRRYRGRVRVVLPRRPAPDLMPLLRWFELSSTPAC